MLPTVVDVPQCNISSCKMLMPGGKPQQVDVLLNNGSKRKSILIVLDGTSVLSKVEKCT